MAEVIQFTSPHQLASEMNLDIDDLMKELDDIIQNDPTEGRQCAVAAAQAKSEIESLFKEAALESMRAKAI